MIIFTLDCYQHCKEMPFTFTYTLTLGKHGYTLILVTSFKLIIIHSPINLEQLEGVKILMVYKPVQETKILLTLTMFLHFVGDHFYCETGFTVTTSGATAWSDPLWDGAGCVADTAHSCDRHGWFHREIESTQDDIEVRWFWK